MDEIFPRVLFILRSVLWCYNVFPPLCTTDADHKITDLEGILKLLKIQVKAGERCNHYDEPESTAGERPWSKGGKRPAPLP